MAKAASENATATDFTSMNYLLVISEISARGYVRHRRSEERALRNS